MYESANAPKQNLQRTDTDRWVKCELVQKENGNTKLPTFGTSQQIPVFLWRVPRLFDLFLMMRSLVWSMSAELLFK